MNEPWSERNLYHGVDITTSSRVKAVCWVRCTQVNQDCNTTQCAYSLWLGAIIFGGIYYGKQQ